MNYLIFFLGMFIAVSMVFSDELFERDIIETKKGSIEITFIGHGTLMMKWKDRIIHIDPYSALADYSKLPKADMILLTHHHGDHLDRNAIDKIKTEKTKFYLTELCHNALKYGKIIKNGDTFMYEDIRIEAIPAYNIKHKRDNGEPYHKKGEGNGYIMTFGDIRILIAGDTENIPEIKELKDIDIAFLPMNLPYTMSPEMVKDAVISFRPDVLYPYHFGNTDTDRLLELLKDEKHIEVRIRKMS